MTNEKNKPHRAAQVILFLQDSPSTGMASLIPFLYTRHIEKEAHMIEVLLFIALAGIALGCVTKLFWSE